jgi:hypothetical protein
MLEENFAKSNFDSMDKTAPVKPPHSNTLLVILLVILAFSFLLLGFVLGCEFFSMKQNRVLKLSSTITKIKSPEASSGAETTNGRLVVKNSELKGIINRENNCGADLKLNQEVPNEWIDFSQNGISFKIPYNKNWGNDKYRFDVFDNYIGKFDASDDIFFGNVVLYEGCSIKRDYQLSFSASMKKTNFLQFVGQAAVEMCDLKENIINGLEVVEYKEFCPKSPENHIVFLGTKNNYDFRSKNDMTEIVKNVKIDNN